MNNAPLIEIIAEVRWAGGRGGEPISIVLGGDDSFYVRLGLAVGKQGYDRLDRVLPEGMPVQAGTVVYRYRRGDDLQNTLFQAGTGLFTANGLPPYNSWTEFQPVIRDGLTALWSVNAFDVREPIELILRYVDAFSPAHLADMTKQAFMETVVGVKYASTDAVTRFAGGVNPDSMRFNAVHRSATGERLLVDVGQGVKDGEEVVVLNTTAVSREFVADNVEAAMIEFAALQDVLHDMFFEMLDRVPIMRQRLTQSGA